MHTIESKRKKRIVRIVELLSQNQKRDEPSIKTEPSINTVEERKESVEDGELPLQEKKPDSLIHHQDQDQDQNPTATPVLDESSGECERTSRLKRKKLLRITPSHTPEEQSELVPDQKPITPIEKGELPLKK
jgi:hypothetical protein